MKKILFAASEAVPFLKTGGLADVAGALPKYLPKDEFDVRVVLPKYTFLREKLSDYVFNFRMDFQMDRKYVGIWIAKYEGITFYLIDNEQYFSGDVPYQGMPNDLGRFAFFSKALLSMLYEVNFKPDIIHCNDWQTALVPIYLDFFKSNEPDGFYKNMKSVLTIHNLKFQGIWNINDVKSVTGLPERYFDYDKLEFYGIANLLKGGISIADKVTTVSKTYANEICSYEFGEGLDKTLNFRRNEIAGIVNGIDYSLFNPEADTKIFKQYNIENFRQNKVENKKRLQAELGFPVDAKKFVVGIVSRLTEQKGMDIIAYVMNDIIRADIQLVVLGTGDSRYEEMFRYFASVFSHNVSANIRYNDELARKIYAGCDAFLMPSLFEPCGLSQLISMKYGTVPVVRSTGGLKDTVSPYSEENTDGTGFVFDNFNAHEMLDAILRAKNVFDNNKRSWNYIVQRDMKQDYSWESAAKEYADLYRSL